MAQASATKQDKRCEHSQAAGSGHTLGRCQQQRQGCIRASGAPALFSTGRRSAAWLQQRVQRQQRTAGPLCCHASPHSPPLHCPTITSLQVSRSSEKNCASLQSKLQFAALQVGSDINCALTNTKLLFVHVWSTLQAFQHM